MLCLQICRYNGKGEENGWERERENSIGEDHEREVGNMQERGIKCKRVERYSEGGKKRKKDKHPRTIDKNKIKES